MSRLKSIYLRYLKPIFSFALTSFLTLLFLIVGYMVFAVVLTLIPANLFSEQPKEGITIYIKSNGVHTDLVLPTENKFYNWNERLPMEDFQIFENENNWTAFGWGDKGFYLYTPEWKDLTVSTAFNALFLPTPTAMHVTKYASIVMNERTRKITLTNEQYLVLCQYIYTSFQKNEEGKFLLIPGYHYQGRVDNFYEAEGSYHALNTCNNWSNSALKTVGVKTALWAPFDKCVFYHF